MLRIRHRLSASAVALALAASVGILPARADVEITGSGDLMQVEAQDSSIADVLDALGATFDPSARKSGLLDRPVSRTFYGSASQVISRLLEGYDYVAAVSPTGQIEIVWISLSARTSGAASGPAPIITRARPVVASADGVPERNGKHMRLSPQIRSQMVERAERLKNNAP
jgi:hypothetical protein